MNDNLTREMVLELTDVANMYHGKAELRHLIAAVVHKYLAFDAQVEPEGMIDLGNPRNWKEFDGNKWSRS